MKILFLAGSLRKDSCNKKLVREAISSVENAGIATEFIDFKGLDIPIYDGDIETGTGVPGAIIDLGNKISNAQAIIISSPEYNGGISCVTKNVVDWLSRLKPMPLANKHLLLLSASPGALGGVRGLWHTRVPFEALGVHVFPNMFGLPNAYEAFNAEGKLTDTKNAQNLDNLVNSFLRYLQGH